MKTPGTTLMVIFTILLFAVVIYCLVFMAIKDWHIFLEAFGFAFLIVGATLGFLFFCSWLDERAKIKTTLTKQQIQEREEQSEATDLHD